MYKRNYEVEVLINGRPAKEYYHEGKVFIEGREGTSYKIKIRNNGCNKIKAVISVDGLNVISGEEAKLNGRGYILNGYNSLTIDGWRKSNSNVHEFYFSDINESYSVRGGKGDKNIGVIGVSIVEEERNYSIPQWSWTYTDKNYYDHTKYPFVTTFSNKDYVDSKDYPAQTYVNGLGMTNYCSNNDNIVMNCSNTIGTGWGKEINSDVINVDFNGKGYSAETFEIFYDTRNGLKQRGISLEKHPTYIESPRAFPGSYCTPPENIRGSRS